MVYKGVIIAGSLGDNTCSNIVGPLCSGDVIGMGTYARFNKISSLSIKYDSSGNEEFLFIADKVNNKIKTLNLKSGKFEVATFASTVDARSLGLSGIVVNNDNGMLYVSVTAGLYSYSISAGSASKAIYAGRLAVAGKKTEASLRILSVIKIFLCITS